MATIYELRATSALGIFAVPSRGNGRGTPVRLPDGAIVELPLLDVESGILASADRTFEVGPGGVPATIHHAQLGLVVGFLSLSGFFLIPSGEVAAVYGAEARPLGVDHASLSRGSAE